jgi:hypothetical protein
MAFIINRYGILHSYPDGQPLPTGARVATAKEVADWEAQDAKNKAVIKREKDAKRALKVMAVEPMSATEEPKS